MAYNNYVDDDGNNVDDQRVMAMVQRLIENIEV